MYALLQFYADDRQDTINIIQTHSFRSLITSRYIRILASTDVRWIGSAEKCFRFEIIGCDPNEVIPEIHFSAKSQPAGYLEASWSEPQLMIGMKRKAL